jgi:hypothetical protein
LNVEGRSCTAAISYGTDYLELDLLADSCRLRGHVDGGRSPVVAQAGHFHTSDNLDRGFPSQLCFGGDRDVASFLVDWNQQDQKDAWQPCVLLE